MGFGPQGLRRDGKEEEAEREEGTKEEEGEEGKKRNEGGGGDTEISLFVTA